MTKRDIVNDIRSVYPEADILDKEQIRAYLNKGRNFTNKYLRDVPKVNTGNKNEYLVLDIAEIWAARITIGSSSARQEEHSSSGYAGIPLYALR